MESRGGNTETKAEGREGGAWGSQEARRGLERQPVFSAVGRNLSSLGVLTAFQDTELGEGSGQVMRMPGMRKRGLAVLMIVVYSDAFWV